VILTLIYSCSGNVIQTSVFTDGFNALDPGRISLADSANPAVYFQEGNGMAGDWSVATSLKHEGFEQAWKIRSEGDRNILTQSFVNLNIQNEPLSLVTHPILVAGDSLWSDFQIEVDFTPMAKFDKCGVVFGYRHPNDFYFFGTEGNTVILKHVQPPVTPLRPIEKILEYRPLVWTPGEEMHAIVTVRRNKIFTILNDTIRMYAEEELFRPGRIGLISDLPARFSRVEVKLLKGELRQLNRKKRQLARRQEIHLERHPGMVRWKAFDIKGFGAGQNVRLGDLTGDGNKELLFARQGTGPGGPLCCISAMNLEGEVLWQLGDQEMPFRRLAQELPVQVHDLDGDGRREVIYVVGGRIQILEGQSGKLVRSLKVPVEMQVSSILFGDLLGTGRDNCMILTDREHHLAVFNERLELMWNRGLVGASQPLLHDMDGDGRDEIMSGYSVLNHEGGARFNTGAFIGDRCNGISLFELHEGERITPCLLYAAGDWGLLYVDYDGNILKQSIIGHVEYLSVADFDMESEGLEVVACNSWGSDGLIHISDASGEVTGSLVSAPGSSRCVPVNWKGDGEEFFILSADTVSGGMFDGDGLLSVRFPADGHPVSCHMVQDLTGDARDEVLVWNNRELWIYTQDDNPRMGHTYNPDRLPLYNYSVHGMNLSLPGW